MELSKNNGYHGYRVK